MRVEEALQLLSKTGVVLTESLDYETVLKAAALLTLESLADICIIDLLDDNPDAPPSYKRMVCMHRDLSKDKFTRRLLHHSPVAQVGDAIHEVVLSRLSQRNRVVYWTAVHVEHTFSA